MKTMKGEILGDKSRPIVSLRQKCIHATRDCNSKCQFFDAEIIKGGSKVMINCTSSPVIILVEHE